VSPPDEELPPPPPELRDKQIEQKTPVAIPPVKTPVVSTFNDEEIDHSLPPPVSTVFSL
jgi:hypothetical protein